MQEEYCTLDPITRKLTLTEPQRIAGVESDENARGLKFKFPKTVDDIDLTQMQLRINFMNSRGEKGQHIVTDLKTCEGEEDYITFTWPFSRLVTHYRGLTKFVICAVKTDENGTITAEWNTALAQMRVLEGLEVDEPEISPEEKDVIAQLISICQNSADEAALSAQQAQEEAEKVLNYGPTIGENGNWYLKGQDTGQPSRGEKGDKGDEGNPGKNGTTPNIQIGTVETLPPGSQATVTNTGTTETPVFNFGIPQGKDGDGSIGEWKLLRTIVQPSDVSIDMSDITWYTREDGSVYGFSFDTDNDGKKYAAKEIIIGGSGDFVLGDGYVDLYNNNVKQYHFYRGCNRFDQRFIFTENLFGSVSNPQIYATRKYSIEDPKILTVYTNIGDSPPVARKLEKWENIKFLFGVINGKTSFTNLKVNVYGRV